MSGEKDQPPIRMSSFGLVGVKDPQSFLRMMLDLGFLPPERPKRLSVSGSGARLRDDVPEDWFTENGLRTAVFPGGEGYTHFDGEVQVQRPPTRLQSVDAFLQLLTTISFRYGSTGRLHDDWKARPDYRVGSLPIKLGWAAFFQGEGHQVLVSRRWLDHGPWRVLRGANDTTLVQFHDLEASSDEAFEQAKPGHEWLMGSDADWAHRGHVPNTVFDREEVPERLASARAMYVPEDRTLRIVVHGREVPHEEMLFACHARTHGLGDEYGPIDAVRYIFMEEHVARAHLPDLWLRELECWTFDEAGNEVRLDEDFHLEPPPKPAWVRRLDERE